MDIVFAALIIFSLKLADTSLGTMRTLLVNRNKPIYAALVGLLESGIWIVAITQVAKAWNDPVLMAAFAVGFAAGIILFLILSAWLG